MIRSMTGFARRERQGPWGTLSCELRSVNHRYLELSLRLPDDLRCLEGDARTLLATSLRRGKVEAGIYLRSATADTAALEINRPLVAELRQRAAEVAEMLGGPPAAISPLDVLRWPGVMRETDRDLAPVATEAMSLLAETVAELNESRGREGARMREILRQRCDTLRERIATVRARLPEVRGTHTIAHCRACGAARGQRRPRPARAGDRAARLQDGCRGGARPPRQSRHRDPAGLDSKEPAGRRLDFLMQELNREANTLSSKSQDIETTRAAVDIKVLIEQMREQVQNIE